MRLGRLARPALVALAFVPGLAEAQPRPLPAQVPDPAPASAPASTPARRAEGVEVGAGSMVVAIFPAFGGHVSVPASRRVRLEFGAQILPWLLEDGEDFVVATQLQARIPLRRGPPGSRRSLLLGVTGFTVADRINRSNDWEFFATVRPHAGASWQWQKSPHVDVRIDLHGVVTGARSFFVVPFATFSLVWHRERRWS